MNNEHYDSLVRGLLGATASATIKDDPAVIFGDVEEPWDLPEGTAVLLTLTEVKTIGFTWGCVRLCQIDDMKFVAEQNASPILVYYL